MTAVFRTDRSVAPLVASCREDLGEAEKAVKGAGRRRDCSLAEVSHDIRSLLYVITGFSELLLDEVPGKINEEQRRSLNDILKSGRRLARILEKFL